MDILVIVIEVFIGGGLFVIVLAPAFKLLKKAGKSQWLALVPGANVLSFMGLSGRPVVRAGLASFLAFPVFAVLYDLLMFQGESPDAKFLILDAVVVFLIAVYVFPYPLLSTAMLCGATFFLALSNPPPAGLALIAAIAIVALAALQMAWDFIGWRAVLKKLGRPAWQIVFLFIPSAAALVLAVASLVAGPLGSPVILGLFLPALFVGFVYYYYLGYSPKVRYQTE
jgi:hypothetical protein